MAITVAAGVGLDARESAASRAASGAAQTTPLDRALLDRYCVTCHNERLMTAGLTLDTVDLTQVAANAAVLEKVARKLRAGQMPPVGRPRPAQATADAFATALEAALDRVATAAPNPGRRPVHRLNRLEYINAIRDLLAIDVDPEWLPVDNAGIGFDNNADILSVTPSLMARYLSATAKVSRLAVGNPAIGPTIQVYRAPEFADQSVRLGEDLPFATHGGLVVRHAFPLNGEYTFKLRLQRNSIGNTIRGIDDEHEIQVRIDHGLVKRFTVGGTYPGHDIGLVNGIPDDDVKAQTLHTYRLTADDQLEFRIPIQAGTRLVTAAFTDSAPAVSELVPLRPMSRKRRIYTDDAGDPSIETLSIEGPYAASAPDDTPSRQRIFVCQPTTAHDAASCARTILGTLARRAYRRPVTEADLAELMRLYEFGRRDGEFDAGIELALEGLLASLPFVFSMEHDPVDTRPGMVYPLSDFELASRLSFFLWKSLPDDVLLTAATEGPAERPGGAGRRSAAHACGPEGVAMDERLRGAMADGAQPPGARARSRSFPRLRRQPARRDGDRDGALLREPGARGSKHLRSLAHGLHLPERAAGAALRRAGRLRESFPAGAGDRSGTARLAGTGEHSHGDVVRGPDIRRAARQMGTRDAAGRTTAAAPTGGAGPGGERPGRGTEVAAGADGAAPREPGVCELSRTDGPVRLRAGELRRDGRWRDTDAGAAIDTSTTLVDGGSIAGPAELQTYLLSRRDEFLRTVTEKLMTYALGRGLEYYDAPAVRQIVREAARDDYRWASVILGVVRSVPFQMRRVADAEGSTTTGVAQRPEERPPRGA